MATHVEGRRDVGAVSSRTRLSTETKRSFVTTEFWAYIAVLAGIFIASYVIDTGDGGGGSDAFDANRAWLYATALTIGYMISRGLAKSGSRERYWSDGDS